MRPEVFLDLCETLEKKYKMRPSRNMTVKESVAIFLYICGHNVTQRSNMRMQATDEQPTLDDEAEPLDEELIGSRQYMEGFRDEIVMDLWVHRR
ncbi:unnamed protein product [Arabis nemorensis]|uniref:DUF8040 domain-containing protein n=1 Tax=Arabis nemorensis TaxID=586526 RepID=A0A565BJ29_9BRAS|nr:unnamed protein product [Arabis nemorensis]